MVRMVVSVYGGETSSSSNGGETSPSRQAVRLSRGVRCPHLTKP